MKKMFLLLTVLFGSLLFLPVSGSADPQAGSNFIVHLSGKDEVPPTDSRAQGETTLQLSDDGMTLSYKLIVANITNVTMAHIHIGAAGMTGPIVVWLYPSVPPPILILGKSSGVLSEGTITAANLVGPLAGQPLSALLDKMKSGEAYVNVHTSGFPAGEIRGQVLWPLAGRIAPTPRAFGGGDYWVTHLTVSRNLLRNLDGTYRDPATYTESDWALVRQYTGYHLGWRLKARFSAPDATGSGTITIIDNGLEHRHMVDQTGCTDCGIIPGTVTSPTLAYTLDANNRLTITDPVSPSVQHGAFSRDFNSLIAAATAGRDAGKFLIMGVKVATAAQTMTGLYAMNGYGVDFDYPVDPLTTPPTVSPVASLLSIGANLSWADISLTGGGLEFTSRTDIHDPALTTAFADAATYSRSTAPSGVGSLSIGPDGTYTDLTNEGDWLAVSPTGQVAIEASGINDLDPRFTTATNDRHHESHGLLLKQPRRVGTFSSRDLAGTYIVVGQGDDLSFTVPSPVTDCHVGPDAIAGSISCGTGLRQRQGTMYGEFTLIASGTMTINANDISDLGVVTPTSPVTGAFSVETECFGFVGGVRLLFTDPICAGGKLLDVVVARDSTGTVFVKFFIGDGGDVLAFFDPKSIAPASGSVGRSRSFGYAVRIR